jgi:Fic family protein
VDTRAGRFVQQPRGYRAFEPASLPPQPPIQFGRELLGALSQADQALGRLDGTAGMLPNPNLFVAMYVRQEAVLSSQIEGTQASLTDVLAFEAVNDGASEGDVEEVVNYVAAMNHGLERLKEFPLSLRLIREIHERLMRGVRGQERQPGEFRTSQNWIGPGGSTLATATFVPPPPHVMQDALSRLERFLHDPDLPRLVHAALAHAQFETIHPFLHGNGRVGRLLITFLLCHGGVLSRPLLYLSHYLKQHRQEYYDRLQAVRLEGRWEEWLLFFLKGVAEVAIEAQATAGKILALRERHRNQLAAEGRASGISCALWIDCSSAP